MSLDTSLALHSQSQIKGLSSCEHRAVSKDGRIVCRKIVVGDDQVSPSVCRNCPFKAVNCDHLCFSLRQTSPSPLIVRFNGRTEIWNDDPPELRFEQAACAVKVKPIGHVRQCLGCALRKPLLAASEGQVQETPRWRQPPSGPGKVVAFPGREAPAVAAAVG